MRSIAYAAFIVRIQFRTNKSITLYYDLRGGGGGGSIALHLNDAIILQENEITEVKVFFIDYIE